MADVRLDFYDLDDDVLPDVCMKCGAPAAARPMKTFSWVPYWARMIPFGIAFMKRRRVPIPLCERHKNHWMIRYLIGFGGLALFLLLLGAAIALLISSDDRTNPARDTLMALGFIVLTGAGIAFLTWLITLIVLLVTQINVFEITDDSIVLTNVSPDFTRAYREQTRGDPDRDDLAGGQWVRPAPGRRPDLPPDDQYRRG